jgi:hypothetical protein
VTKVQKVKKAPKQRSTHGVSMGESPSQQYIIVQPDKMKKWTIQIFISPKPL